MIGASRRKRGPDPHLQWKVGLFFAGAAVALVGFALDSRVVVGAATLILVAGFGLRFLPAGDREGEDEDEEGSQGRGSHGNAPPDSP